MRSPKEFIGEGVYWFSQKLLRAGIVQEIHEVHRKEETIQTFIVRGADGSMHQFREGDFFSCQNEVKEMIEEWFPEYKQIQ